jgi:NMD protein affecting ribosome stability and mRNA decay
MARFCPKCGKSIDNGTFCNDCKPRILDYKLSSFKICCVCSKLFTHGSWKDTKDLQALIIKEIKSKIKQKDVEVKLVEDLPELKPGIQETLTAEVTKEGVVHEIPYKIEITYCNICAKKGTQYFEGILQIRGSNKERDKVINMELDREAKNGNVANKTVNYPNGIDLYMTHRRSLPKLAQRIVESIGGLYTLNAKLFSVNHMTGKEIYRLNVLLELPEFDAGDVFLFKGKYVVIVSFGKKITARNLLTNKKIMFPYVEFKKIKEKDSESVKKLDTYKTTIIRLHPNQEVLHPENYQPVKVLNQIDDAKEDQKVKIILVDKGAIIV